MERVKRRKLKFPCLFGGNDETPRHRTIQSWCSGNATTDYSLFKFQVGKSTSKRSNQNRKRSSGILAKLMGKDGISSARPINNQQKIKLETKVSESDIPQKRINLLKPDTIDSENPDQSFDDCRKDIEYFSSESEVITVPYRITFGLNDRLTHSLSNISESSLISEAKNKISEKWKMSQIHEDVVITASKNFTLREILSFSDKQMKPVEWDRSTSSSTSVLPSFQDSNPRTSVCHEADGDEKMMVHSEPLNRREILKGICYHEEDIALKQERSSKRRQLFPSGNVCSIEFGNYLPENQSRLKSTEACFKDEGPVKYEPFTSEFDDGATKHAFHMVGYANSYEEIEETSSQSSQEPLNANSGGAPLLQFSGPSEDVSSRSDHFERLDSELRDLKKQLHLLKVECLLSSKRPTLNQKRDQHGQEASFTAPEPVTWESSFSRHILQSSDIYETDPDTIHHPRDPRLFYRIEKCYFNGAVLSKSEKHLLYDYIEQTFIKISKSMVAHSRVNPEKEKSQLMLSELSIEDQMVKVVEEIDIEDAKNFLVSSYDKNTEWLEQNQIKNLGNLLSELVLADLVLEVIKK